MWVSEEFGHLKVADARLRPRVKQMAKRAMECGGGRISDVFWSGAERQGAYDLLEGGRVPGEILAEAMAAACVERSPGSRWVFVPLDGSSIKVVDRGKRTDLGLVGTYTNDGRGLQVVSCMSTMPRRMSNRSSGAHARRHAPGRLSNQTVWHGQGRRSEASEGPRRTVRSRSANRASTSRPSRTFSSATRSPSAPHGSSLTAAETPRSSSTSSFAGARVSRCGHLGIAAWGKDSRGSSCMSGNDGKTRRMSSSTTTCRCPQDTSGSLDDARMADVGNRALSST